MRSRLEASALIQPSGFDVAFSDACDERTSHTSVRWHLGNAGEFAPAEEEFFTPQDAVDEDHYGSGEHSTLRGRTTHFWLWRKWEGGGVHTPYPGTRMGGRRL